MIISCLTKITYMLYLVLEVMLVLLQVYQQVFRFATGGVISGAGVVVLWVDSVTGWAFDDHGVVLGLVTYGNVGVAGYQYLLYESYMHLSPDLSSLREEGSAMSD